MEPPDPTPVAGRYPVSARAGSANAGSARAECVNACQRQHSTRDERGPAWPVPSCHCTTSAKLRKSELRLYLSVLICGVIALSVASIALRRELRSRTSRSRMAVSCLIVVAPHVPAAMASY